MKETFKTIARFQYSTEAQIIKGRLEAEGIPVFLSDALTIDVDPLVSQAIGGVKLKVRAEDAMKAQYILDKIAKYALDDEGNPIRCPNCQSSEIALFSTIKDLKSFMAFVFGFLSGTLPFYRKDRYRCNRCDTEFDLS